ncbi:MAG: glycosyltransferase [Acidimicrobiia bacterium]
MNGSPAEPESPELDDDAWIHALEASPLLASTADLDEPELPEAPPVVALIVTRNPGDWFEGTLASLGESEYPNLTVFVVDAGSDVDPTPRVAAILPNAFVQLLEGQPGFAGAANQALSAVQGAAFLMLCHDDVVLAPDAVRILVAEAFRSNAAIVGPKIVRVDDPQALLEVGMSVDRFGVPYSGIEPGEIDQEQHDGIRDVFFVSDAAMLIRTDLFAALGGFDGETFPGGEDLDLCWRARLQGARIMVNPNARVGHRKAADERPALDQSGGEQRTRNRLRALLKCSSTVTLLWVVPVGFVLALIEAFGALVTGRRNRARALVGAWTGSIPRWGSIRRARKPVQKNRVVHDRELRYLQVRGSVRLKRFVTYAVRPDERLEAASSRRSYLAALLRDRNRGSVFFALLAFALLTLLGSRGLFAHLSVVGSLLPWKSVHALWETYTSAWRFTAAGANAPAPAPLAWMALLGVLLGGHVGAAQTVIVVATIPVGAWGATRLARAIFGRRAVTIFVGLAYAVIPVSRNAIADGRFGAMVFFALMPWFLMRVWRASGLAEDPGREGVVAPRLLGTAFLAMVMVAIFPPALLLLPAVGLAVWCADALRRDARRARRSLGILVAALAIGCIGLLPWFIGFSAGVDWVSLGFVFQPELTLAETVRFVTGPSGTGISGWFLLTAVVLSMLLTTGTRFAWVARGAALAVVGFVLSWVPGQMHLAVPMPATEGILSVAALGFAIVLGTGAILVVEELRVVGFGWRQVLAVIAMLCVIPSALGFGVDALNGRWRQPKSDWQTVLALGSEPGGYRMLWLGDPEVLPGDPLLRGDRQGFALTRDSAGWARDLWPPPSSDAMEQVSSALSLAERDRTVRLGHALSPLGIRYVAIVDRAAPDAAPAGMFPAETARGLARQTDLARRRMPAGMTLYENRAWAPIRSTTTTEVPRGNRLSLASAIPVDLATATPVAGTAPVPAGTVLWGEAASSAWTASSNGRSLERFTAFGTTNAYDHPDDAPVALHNRWQWTRWIVVIGQCGVWSIVAIMLIRTWIRRRRTRPVVGAPVVDVPHSDVLPTAEQS